MTELELRQAVIDEAMTWLGTPFHNEGRIKQVGVDCSMLLYETYHAVGLIPAMDIAHYNVDWHLHNNEETYLSYITKHAVEMPLPPDRIPKKADIVVWKFARAFAHGAIVMEWPTVIHAHAGKTVNIDNCENMKWLTMVWENEKEGRGKVRPMKVFSLKEWAS